MKSTYQLVFNIKNMKINPLMLLLLFAFVNSYSQDVPQTNISNGLVKVKIYLPDSENGYYRATRFDWSGIIPELVCNGHSYFGKWFKNYDPKVHESVMGPVEEFTQIGYENAKVGESFLKIGVGTLVKKKEPKYRSFNLYEIRNHGKWDISERSNEVEFKQILNSDTYSYEYVKLISLPKGKSEMVLSHKFTNTGKKTIETKVYNHNFFFIDSLNIGPDYVVKFPFDIVANKRVKGIGEFAEIEKNEIKFIKDMQEGNQVYIESITGYDINSKEYDIIIENKETRAGVKIHCNRPLSKLVFWSVITTVCPEPFISIKADPEETVTWEITYTFYSY